MKAGRELDALVAEKVMGARLGISPINGSSGYCYWPNGRCGVPPYYSSDIAAAWLVVEKMAELHVVSVSCMFNKRWRCEAVQAHSQRQTPVNAIADTAPLAICMAALIAVGVKVQE